MRNWEGMHQMPEYRPIDWGNVLVYLVIALGTIVFWSAVVKYTGLYGWLVANVTKDMLGYAAAAVFILGFLLVTTLRDRRGR